MSWIDDIERSVKMGDHNDRSPVIITVEKMNRLISEARKMERVREWFGEFGIGGWRDELREILGEKDE